VLFASRGGKLVSGSRIAVFGARKLMSELPLDEPSIPRLASARIRNYRALRDMGLSDLPPLTVFLGPNGSGKSTFFDALAFVSEAFTGAHGARPRRPRAHARHHRRNGYRCPDSRCAARG
jgi:hypothetical protein